eukprot:TRINITY_DN3997_c0_g1_i2.p1 TRINITY_DN3997_c0_g1~~TRINITY_DN3997_c0_g1_i2.p1  ORF type:complete len:322 (+),score=69.10 TRINITY_DN3997_c0_g1_i2:565-1530(+)
MQTPFLVYLVCIFTVVSGLSVFYRRLKLSLDEGTARKSAMLLPLIYAAASAMMGSLSVLLAKSSSQLLRKTLAGDNQLDSWFTYIVLAGWVALMIFWMQRLNSGLRQFPSMIIVPALQVFWTVFSIIGGGICFQEFDAFTWQEAVGFGGGVVIIILGVAHLSPHWEPPPVLPTDSEEMVPLHDDGEYEGEVPDSDGGGTPMSGTGPSATGGAILTGQTTGLAAAVGSALSVSVAPDQPEVTGFQPRNGSINDVVQRRGMSPSDSALSSPRIGHRRTPSATLQQTVSQQAPAPTLTLLSTVQPHAQALPQEDFFDFEHQGLR